MDAADDDRADRNEPRPHGLRRTHEAPSFSRSLSLEEDERVVSKPLDEDDRNEGEEETDTGTGLRQRHPVEASEGSLPRRRSIDMSPEEAVRLWSQIESAGRVYGWENVLLACCGLALLLFGRQFFALVTASEAMLQIGGVEVWRQGAAFWRALTNAELREMARGHDAARAGLRSQLARRVELIGKTASPRSVDLVVGSAICALLAMVASLRLRVVRCASLGIVLGDLVAKPTEVLLVAPLQLFSTLERWRPLVLKYACRAAGVLLACIAFAQLRTLHSTVRGAHLLYESLYKLQERSGAPMAFHVGKRTEFTVVGCFVVLGLVCQNLVWLEMPLPVKLLLLPILALEALVQALFAPSFLG